MAFKVVNDLFILIWHFRNFVILDTLLSFMDPLDLLNFDLLSSLFYHFLHWKNSLVQCDAGCPFWRHRKYFIFSNIFYYMEEENITSPNPLSKNFTSELVCRLKLYLVYVYISMSPPCLFLGYWPPHVVLYFCKSTFNLLCLFPLFWRKNYERYLSFVSFFTSGCSYGLRS